MEKSCKDRANELLLRQMERLEEETDAGWPRGQDGRWLATMLCMLANAIQYPQPDYTRMVFSGYNAKQEIEEAAE